MKKQSPPTETDLVEAAFPAEFLDGFSETAIKALEDYLSRINASRDAITLLETLYILKGRSCELAAGAKIRPAANRALIADVADASRCIVALGGVFYTPSGSTLPREVGS